MKDDAVYIVSGIIDVRADEVREAVRKDFEITGEYTLGGWYCFSLRKKQAD